MGHLAYSWLSLQLTPPASQLATDKTLKHCQCVWISLILLAKWVGTKVPYQGVPAQLNTHSLLLQAGSVGGGAWGSCCCDTKRSTPFCMRLKSALRVFSKYTNTCRGLPCQLGRGVRGVEQGRARLGVYALLMWNYRSHFISAKLEHVPWHARWFWLITSAQARLGWRIPC